MKNFYSLNPAEFFVAEEIKRRRPGLQVFHPLEDMGADLLVVDPKRIRPIYIQVKESRFHGTSSWHQMKAGKEKDADIFVFVTYIPTAKGARLAFQKDYIVIPRERLIKLCTKKAHGGGKYSFYFESEAGKVYEVRDNRTDVTKYHEAWHLI